MKSFAFLATLALSSALAFGQGEAPAPEKKLNAEEVAKELANPNTPLASLTLKTQFSLFTGSLPGAQGQNGVLSLFQPSFPMPISRKKTSRGVTSDRIFFRPAIPFLFSQPLFDAGQGDFGRVTGMADIGFDLMWARSVPPGIVFGGGIISTLPTGRRALSAGTWTLGPEAVLAFLKKWGVVAIRIAHEWNVAGSRNLPTSGTTIQPAFVYLLGGGWSCTSAPTLTRDWLDGQWTIPLHVGVSRTVIFGRTPVKVGVEMNYYVERPEAFGPRWMFSFNITPVVPNVLAAWLKLK